MLDLVVFFVGILGALTAEPSPATGEPPLSCRLAPADSEVEIAACADRDAKGGIHLRPDALRRLTFDAQGVASARIEGILFFVCRNGRTAPALPFDNGPDEFHQGLARSLVNGKVGFVDRRLRQVVAPTWDFAFPFDQGLAVVCLGCVAKSEGEHTAMVGGRWGMIDRSGRIVVPVRFSREELPPISAAARGVRTRKAH